MIQTFSACRYRFCFLKSEAFDNVYIDQHFLKIDRARAESGKESLIPLNMRERVRYINPWDLKMTIAEKVKKYISLTVFGMAFINVVLYLSLDFLLYQIMNGLNDLMDLLSTFQKPELLSINVEGSGYMADTYRSAADQVVPKDNIFDGFLECKPKPNRPDFELYVKIANFMVIVFISIFTEAYGLRLRHIVAGFFYPNRIPVRAVWLYNNILCQRGDFVQFMRRQLKRKAFGDQSEEQISVLDRICAQYPIIRIICKLFGIYTDSEHCLSCGKKEKEDDKNTDNFIRCPNNCKGVYCANCFSDINNICTLCMSPIEYDFEDMSEEHDSSDEDIFYIPKRIDYLYQYRETQKYRKEDDDDYDSKRSSKRDLVSIAYSDDKESKVPTYMKIINEEDLGYDADHDQIVSEDNLSLLERELNIPKNEIIRMKRNAKQFVDENDNTLVNEVKKERLSKRKKEDDQRLVRNSLLMTNSDKKKYNFE